MTPAKPKVLALAALAAAAACFCGALLAREAMQGGDSGGKADPPRRKGLVVFVVDASSSMRIRDAKAGIEQASRFEAASREVTDTISGLMDKGEFLFDVVLCSGRVETLSGSVGLAGPLKLDEAACRTAATFLSSRVPGGMTRLFDAVAEGFRICGHAPAGFGPGTLCLFTDGVPTYEHAGRPPENNEEFLKEVAQANKGGVKINAFAISATSESIAFLQDLCAAHRGILFVKRAE